VLEFEEERPDVLQSVSVGRKFVEGIEAREKWIVLGKETFEVPQQVRGE